MWVIDASMYVGGRSITAQNTSSKTVVYDCVCDSPFCPPSLCVMKLAMIQGPTERHLQSLLQDLIITSANEVL
jgi:hypothetical protein